MLAFQHWFWLQGYCFSVLIWLLLHNDTILRDYKHILSRMDWTSLIIGEVVSIIVCEGFVDWL